MKKELDERQEQVINKIGTRSFYVMFGVCLAVIVVKLLWKGSLENVFGETLVFLTGGTTCLIGNIKNGIWTRTGVKMSIAQNLLLSVICSGFFSILYAVILSGKVDDSVPVARFAALFFVGITALCFICLLIMGKFAHNKKEEQEKKYSE